jgi:hypothetical protein
LVGSPHNINQIGAHTVLVQDVHKGVPFPDKLVALFLQLLNLDSHFFALETNVLTADAA